MEVIDEFVIEEKKQKVEEEEQEHADTPATDTATVPRLDLSNPAAEVADAGAAAAAATPAAADDEDDDDADDDDDDDAEGCPADLLTHRLVHSMVRPPERGAHPVSCPFQTDATPEVRRLPGPPASGPL